MTERPILFSSAMVRAILDGRKTQTRRVVKAFAADPGCADLIRVDAGVATFGHSIPDDPVPIEIRCPYGVPGDRLWVRETWQTTSHPSDRETSNLVFAADHDGRRPGFVEDEWCWRPSIHMPRWASRMTLEVTEVRVQRLKDISEEDARAEGVVPFQGKFVPRFIGTWMDIHGSRAPWSSNPWVWCLSFKVVQP